jgi:hypothetical protein
MKYYGSGGSVTKVANACEIRLLAEHSNARGMGLGRTELKSLIFNK